MLSVPGRSLFLNEDLYSGQLDAEQYLDSALAILSRLCEEFSSVLFKFHPRETAEWRRRICERVLSRLPGVQVIKSNAGIEDIVDQYRPSIAVSYLSAGLLNLLYRGVEPLYIYHLFPELRDQPLYRETTEILRTQGYNFVPSIAAISASYRSGLGIAPMAAEATSLRALAGSA